MEESETVETADAMSAYERLSQVFFRFRVCLLHGRMSAAEKDKLMSEFADGQYDVMVTTTVAEVGVDIPNASIITIDGANRFGLAQLHQFRGRVGRGEDQAYCFLIPDEAAAIDIDRIRDRQAGRAGDAELSVAERRLAAVEESNDGFHLAEVDLQLRGVGDLLGRRQSGQSYLQLLGQEFTDLAELSRREALTIIEEDPALALPEHQLLAQRVGRMTTDPGDVS